MMRIVTYSEARQNLASLLDYVKEEGEILIRRSDGSEFSLKVADKGKARKWPGIESGLSRKEILSALRESRERG